MTVESSLSQIKAYLLKGQLDLAGKRDVLQITQRLSGMVWNYV